MTLNMVLLVYLEKVNGRWQLSPYFDKVLNSYFMGGI